VLALFAVCALIVPALTPVATTDDWGYTRSVEIFRETGELTVFPVVAATAVFQIVWGVLFSYLFGMSLGVMRLATLVMTGIGAAAGYWLFRQLGATPSRAGLGAATYLFNPLSFILSYTFMTDAHFTALMVLATALSMRGLRADDRAGWALVGGSVASSCAFLTRQQGILVPIAVLLFLIVIRRVPPNRAGITTVARVALIPMLTLAGYYYWLVNYNDVPDVQQGFFREARRAGLDGAWTLTSHLTFHETMYIGAFCLPLTLAAVPMLFRLPFNLRWWGLPLIGTGAVLFATGILLFEGDRRQMPYIPQFVGSGGLGPADVRGGRARIVEQPWFDVATIVCAISAAIMIVLIGRAASNRVRAHGVEAALTAVVLISQIGGVIPPSFHYLRRNYSLDRYLLPLLPLAIALLLWALRDVPIAQWLGWLTVGAFAVVNVAVTRDYLVFMDTVWETADRAVAAGARHDQVDAGAAWDGYHLYTYGLENDITRARTRGGPWWMTFYGLASDSTYMVSSKPQQGYVLVAVFQYETWLPSATREVYLLRKAEAPPLPVIGDAPLIRWTR
jgi:4-amino-4-deoxy-L-arabinose transferase-like glycosyltransferase